MRFVVLSDTHGEHDKIELPDGDVLIHAGDVSTSGRRNDILSFLEWFSQLPHRHKIFIAGNHDFFFEKELRSEVFKIIPDNVTYLEDSGTTINGIEIWGSPITPWFNNWAFNRQRGVDIRTYWSQIPEETGILITHGPPFRRLDTTTDKRQVGCKDLFNRIEVIKPGYHLFGHVHEAYGIVEKKGTTFINASIMDESYKIKNRPVIFDIP